MSNLGLQTDLKTFQLKLYQSFSGNNNIKVTSNNFIKELSTELGLEMCLLIKKQMSSKHKVLASADLNQVSGQIQLSKSTFVFPNDSFVLPITRSSKAFKEISNYNREDFSQLFLVQISADFYLILGKLNDEALQSKLIRLKSVLSHFGFYLDHQYVLKNDSHNEYEEAIKAVVSSSPNSVIYFDKNESLVIINQKAYEFFDKHYGIELKEGMCLSEKSMEAVFGDKIEFMRRALKGEFFHFQKIIPLKGSEVIHAYEIFYRPVKNKFNETIGVLSLAKDDTATINAHKKLRQSEERFKSLIENSPTGIIRLNKDGIITYTSPLVDKIIGYEPNYFLEKSLYDIVQEKDRSRFKEKLASLTKEEPLQLDVFKINNSSGQSISLEGIASVIASKDEDFQELILALNNVTKRVTAESEIIERKKVYETLIQNSFDGIDIISYSEENGKLVGGQMIMRNKLMNDFLNTNGSQKLYDSREALMELAPEIQPDGTPSFELLTNAITQVIKKRFSKADFRMQYEGKSFRDITSSQRLIYMDDKVYLIRNYRDITSRKKQEQIIQKQIEDLNLKNAELLKYIDSNLQLENFAYIASHDLKAPIRSVISFMQLLKNNIKDQIDDKNLKFVDIVLEASVSMQVLIDDLLAFSRINTQKVEIEKLDLRKLIKRLLIEINSSIEEKNGRIIVKNIPEFINGDESRVRQIFQNLMTNGLKFTKEGAQPEVIVDCKENSTHYQFSVSDNGIGIEADYLDKIFLMFKKLHSENKYTGTGIGLSICKKVVEQHDGVIWVESEFGKGSTFYFTIRKNLALT